MNAAQPLALIGAVLLLPLVAAYMHRRKRRVQPVPSAILFRVIAGDHTPTRRTLAQPRHLLSLLLMALALVGLVLALADLRPEEERPRDYVVVLDTSASMGATIPGSDQTRLDHAREVLAKAVSSLSPGDRLALVTSGERSTVAIGATEDYEQVLELAAATEPAGSSAAMPQALAIADAMASANDATVILLSDGVGVGTPSLQHMPQWVRVGTAGPNVGINALAVREADALGLTEVYLAVSSNTVLEQDVEIVLRVDDVIVDVLPFSIPGKGTFDRLHRLELPDGQRVIASLRGHPTDALAADDVAVAPRRAGNRVQVLLVTTSRRSFAAQALRLHPRVDLTTIGPYDAVPSPPTDSAWDLAVLEATPKQNQALLAEHILALGVPAESVGLRSGVHVAAPEILRWTYEHPLFRFVDLQAIDLPRATTIVPAADVTALVDSEQGPLVTVHQNEQAQVVYFGFEPRESDLVLRVGFVNLMANVVEWAAPGPTDDAPADPEADAEHPSPTADVLGAVGVLPASETLLDPPTAIPGTTVGDFASGPVHEQATWRWLVWVVAALVVLEGLIPLAHAGWGRLQTARARARSKRRS